MPNNIQVFNVSFFQNDIKSVKIEMGHRLTESTVLYAGERNGFQ